jgi:hypothetical protein
MSRVTLLELLGLKTGRKIAPRTRETTVEAWRNEVAVMLVSES